MPMSRKDYVKVADILKKYRSTMEEKDFADLVDDFSYMFELDNKNFLADRFVGACNEQTTNNTSSTRFSGWSIHSSQNDDSNAKRRLARN